jgi:hypothetical protein
MLRQISWLWLKLTLVDVGGVETDLLVVVEVDPHLIVGDVETDLLAAAEVDPHLVVGDVETDLGCS